MTSQTGRAGGRKKYSTSSVLAGDIVAAARMLRGVEDETPEALEQLKEIYRHTGKAYIIGLTGAAGVGKSTSLDTLIRVFRKKGMKVGVIAVDPTSPFTGGAILGDRIRMQRASEDESVFIRSIATRGWKGGLAKAVVSMVHVMDAMGNDIVFVETVGAGQGEIDIAGVADTSLVILVPGLGDEIQMMKAGIMEAADIFVINKADREGATNLRMELEVMLDMKVHHVENEWRPGVVMTEAISGKGGEELGEAILKHRDYLVSTGQFEKRRREKARIELMAAIDGALKQHIHENVDGNALDKLLDNLINKKDDPYSAAQRIVQPSVNTL